MPALLPIHKEECERKPKEIRNKELEIRNKKVVSSFYDLKRF